MVSHATSYLLSAASAWVPPVRRKQMSCDFDMSKRGGKNCGTDAASLEANSKADPATAVGRVSPTIRRFFLGGGAAALSLDYHTRTLVGPPRSLSKQALPQHSWITPPENWMLHFGG